MIKCVDFSQGSNKSKKKNQNIDVLKQINFDELNDLFKTGLTNEAKFQTCQQNLNIPFVNKGCESYCQMFNFASASNDFEGNFLIFKHYYRFYRKIKIFTKAKNKLIEEINTVESYMDKAIKERIDETFIKTIDTDMVISSFKTDVLDNDNEGIDIYKYIEGSVLKYTFKSTKIIALLLISYLIIII